MLSITKEVDWLYLEEELWGSAVSTMETIIEEGKAPELMCLLEELFPEPIDITIINDLLWFEPELVYEQLGIEA